MGCCGWGVACAPAEGDGAGVALRLGVAAACFGLADGVCVGAGAGALVCGAGDGEAGAGCGVGDGDAGADVAEGSGVGRVTSGEESCLPGCWHWARVNPRPSPSASDSAKAVRGLPLKGVALGVLAAMPPPSLIPRYYKVLVSFLRRSEHNSRRGPVRIQPAKDRKMSSGWGEGRGDVMRNFDGPPHSRSRR